MSNPLLSKVKLPGRIFQLPSKGLFYKPGTVLKESIKDGEVQVQPLSALAEMKLRSVDLLFNGRALREICEECIPDILMPDMLISKDIDALFCFLRIATYGAEMKINTVHECKPTKTHSYVVNLETVIANPNNDSLQFRDMSYEIKLPNGHKVRLRPITFKDSIDVSHIRQELERKYAETPTPDNKLIERMVIRDIMSVIDSVTVVNMPEEPDIIVTDTLMIEEWVRSLQRTYIDMMTSQAERANEWGYNLSVKLKCKECGEEFDYQLELDPINFFSG